MLLLTNAPSLRISSDRRYFVWHDIRHHEVRPFFWLGDTAWELFHRLDRNETLFYLEKRAFQGFNVIQAVALAELKGLEEPNANGDLPLIDFDPRRPNEPYWEHIDWVVNKAGGLGLHIAMLPTWGDKWNRAQTQAREIFTPENASIYGQWIASRYRGQGVIWILGGDRAVETESHRQIITSMARGIQRGDPEGLIGFHPLGGQGSIHYFPNTDWLSFHGWQSCHGRNTRNDRMIELTLRAEQKPVLDLEPGYEDHPVDFKLENGYLEDYDCRRSFYQSVFSGACGHTYGCHPVWQFWDPQKPGRYPISLVRRPWQEAIDLPGASQLQHGKRLMEAYSFADMIPEPSRVRLNPPIDSVQRQPVAIRRRDGQCMLVYFPFYDAAEIDLTGLGDCRWQLQWFDPRTGQTLPYETLKNIDGWFCVQPPMGVGPDWVLIIEKSSS